MITEILTDAIKQNVGPLKAAPKRWFKRNCMMCHTKGHGKDIRNRMGIQFNPNSIVVNCFNCSFASGYTEGKELTKSFKLFLSHLNIDKKFITELEFEIFKQRNNIQVIREGDEEQEVDVETKFRDLFKRWKPMDLPANSLPISTWLQYNNDDPNFLKVVNYAKSRHIHNFEDLYWSPDKLFNVNQRLILPYYYDGKIVGFTARLGFNPPDKSIPKYFQQCPTDFVYNLDHQQAWQRKYAIVTEGVLDAYTVDGISILGEISQSKIDIINRLYKQVIVCADEDNKGTDLVEVAIENKWAVAFPKWDREIKDAASASEKYGRLLTLNSIISTAVTNETKIRIHWKTWLNDRNRIRKYG